MGTFISVISDEEKLLTKHFELCPETGKLIKNAPEHTTKGTIESVAVTPSELQTLIEGLQPNQCLCLGVLSTPGKHEITCTALQKNGTPVRSKEFLNFFPGSSYLLLDMDDSGLEVNEAVETLAKIDPQFSTASLLHVPSSSSYLYADGKPIVEAGNYHFFVEIEGDRDPKEYGLLLFDRMVLAGYGKPHVTNAGTIVIKSIFDKAVFSPEREIFSAPPVCKPPLVSNRLTHASYQEGTPIDSDRLQPLTVDEEVELRLRISELRSQVVKEAQEKRKAHNEKRARTTAKIKGTNHLIELANQPDSPTIYDKQGRPIIELLSSDVILDEQANELLIRDLILEPQVGLRLPDPLEPFKRGDERRGIPGKGIATMLKENMIYSHHHSGQIFLLRWAPTDLVDYLNSTAPNDEKTAVWKSIAAGIMELSAATTESDLSEIADAVKVNLQNHRAANVPKEKKHVLSKLKPAKAPDGAEDEVLLQMNCQYGLAKIDGKCVIISEEWVKGTDSFEVQYSTPPHMDTWTKNKPMKVTTQNQPVSLYKWWEQHPERLEYDCVEFEPNNHTFRTPGKRNPMPQGRCYNLFRGYLLEPAKATQCDLIVNHIKEVWCGNIEEEFKYAMGWLAHLFQKPAEVSGTALVLQSVPGAGKGIIIENIIVKTLGAHAISTANSEDLTGRFNSHLGINLFFYANELSYTAQASVKSILKTLLTDDNRMIEAKNVNKIKAKNYSSVIFSANTEWMLNIEAGDRRFSYLTVSSHRVGQRDYFQALLDQINNGGREAFIMHLLNYDLTGYDPQDIPNRTHRQRKADFLRSTHPSVRMVWGLMDVEVEPAIYATNVLYASIKNWRQGGMELVMNKAQFFDLFVEYCSYYQVNRSYDDATNISLQLEAGGILKRETDPRSDFPMERRKQKDGKLVLVLKPIDEARKLLNV